MQKVYPFTGGVGVEPIPARIGWEAAGKGYWRATFTDKQHTVSPKDNFPRTPHRDVCC